MKHNMGKTDRMIRTFLIAPLAVVVALIVGAGSVGGIILLALAAIMVGTSAVGFCPLYPLLGVNTCHRTAHHG